jgi:hypothetical protein
MSDMPIQNKANETGNKAVTLCQQFFEKTGWIFRRASNDTDFGIDAEVEIKDTNEVTGKMFKCQIKGTETIKWRDDVCPLRVKTSSWYYWKSLRIPVVVLFLDTNKDDIYWCNPFSYYPKEKTKSVTMKFIKNNDLRHSFDGFRGMIETWLESFPDGNILKMVPAFNDLYKELSANIGGDLECEIGEEEEFKVKLFYKHVMELRLSVGLTNEAVFPLDLWYMRNQVIFDDIRGFSNPIFDELIKYIGVFYEEAIGCLSTRIKGVEPTYENQELFRFFNRCNIYFFNAIGNAEGLMPKMEDVLKRMNVLKITCSKVPNTEN